MQVLGVVGPSGAGKTTLIERLVGRLVDDRLVATVKSIHHDVAVDEPGTDTHRHRDAGALATVGVTPTTTFGFAGRGKQAGDQEIVPLEPVLRGYADRGVAVTLVEGFGDASIPKIRLGGSADPAEPVVASFDDEDAPLDEVVTTLDGLRHFETARTVAAREAAMTDGCVAVASASGPDVAGPHDWAHYRVAERLRSIQEDVEAAEGVERSAVDVRPPVVEWGDGTVHLAVVADERDVALDAVTGAGDRLDDVIDPSDGVDYRLRER